MPENNQERILPGESSVTPSSDAAIKSVLEGLTGEITGLPNPEIVVDGEPLKPITDMTGAEEKDTLKQTNVVSINPKLDHTHSRSALAIRQQRLEKKAA